MLYFLKRAAEYNGNYLMRVYKKPARRSGCPKGEFLREEIEEMLKQFPSLRLPDCYDFQILTEYNWETGEHPTLPHGEYYCPQGISVAIHPPFSDPGFHHIYVWDGEDGYLREQADDVPAAVLLVPNTFPY